MGEKSGCHRDFSRGQGLTRQGREDWCSRCYPRQGSALAASRLWWKRERHAEASAVRMVVSVGGQQARDFLFVFLGLPPSPKSLVDGPDRQGTADSDTTFTFSCGETGTFPIVSLNSAMEFMKGT